MLRLITIAILALWALPASAERHALVVGIDEYQSISDLQKARNDAIAVSEVLEANGFNVTTLLDADQREFSAAVSALASTLSEDDEAFFYFAGHGVEVDGRNYLLPADIPALTAGDEFLLDSTSISADRALSAIQGSGARVTVMVLDACRDNPFPSDGRRSLGQSRGLAAIEVPEGAFIIYAAGIGQSALDRLSDDDPDPNSVFTRVLLPLLAQPDLPIHEVARQIRREVSALASSISHDQRPAYYDEMLGEFVVAENTNISAEEAYLRGLEFYFGTEGREQDDTAAARWFELAAQQRHSHAQFLLGSMYYDGRGFVQDFTEAAQWFRLAAQQGDVDGQSYLGYMYLTGTGLPQDYAQALYWIRQAASQGLDRAQNNLGNMYITGRGVPQDYDEAAQWYRLAAEQGYNLAQFNLGNVYSEGLGVTQDYAEAAQWYRLAAEQGYNFAQLNLGNMYHEGLGVTQDYAEAAQWYRLAAEQGLDLAQYRLGLMYEHGVGVSQDHEEATHWYRLAAEQGDERAQAQLEAMDYNSADFTAEEAYQRGREFRYGFNGREVDLTEAVRWYFLAARQSHAGAQNALGYMYMTGRGVPQDYDDASWWYRLAAEQGLDGAQFNLGLMHYNGWGVEQNYSEAARWYQLAAEQGHTIARSNLSLMYRQGRGVPQDEDEARRWAQLASGHSPADLGALRPIPRPTD